MSTPLATHIVAAASESSGGVNHWIVGAVTLAALLGAMVLLLIFAGGREHS